MPRLAANLSTMFTQLPFLDRIGAAARAGFRAVECQHPYAEKPESIAERLRGEGLEWVLFNSPAGNSAAGERGIACLPGRQAEFAEGIHRALEYVAAGGCRRIHVMAGLATAGVDRGRCIEQYVESLRVAADLLAPAGVTALIEPINTRVDVPGYLLDSTRLALEVIERCNRPNLKLQYDVYHMQIMEGDLARSIERLLPWIGHMQIADNPGRHEPGSGEIAFDFLLDRIAALGYEGWIGCEYLPAGDTAAGLGWARRYLAHRGPIARR
jgi:hydroxypyruvate isomerase